ncbi:MAG: DUF58 domain-containing protein [Acidobacteria bacterium ACB1]|nr:hypothetical protein [Pyrinomonadaceae bacterium]MCE7962768.1 DUF58 domain-containing protein [Acidobacteria bacterium ACB1]RIJ95425.1 MAG: hypothetical protein DCC44_02240 [Acidobacteriota bacterium]
MDFRLLLKLISKQDLRNSAIGIVVVTGGLALAGLTLYAHEAHESRLAAIAAGLSLLFILLILIFVIPPLAKKASREASQMNLPFEFTLGGSVILVLVLVVGFSAWNTGNNLLFIVLSVMLAAMTVGFAVGWLALRKLEIRIRFPETIYAQEAFPITLELTNGKRTFPAFSIVAEVRGKERETIEDADEIREAFPAFIAKRLLEAPHTNLTLDHIAYIPHRGMAERRVSHTFPQRGRFKISDFELSTGFPFGFVRHRRRLAANEADILIFPRRSSENPKVEITSAFGSREPLKTRGAGDDLLFLRDYEAADDLRRIDWKATARTQRITVREFAGEADARVRILIGGFAPSNDGPSLRERLAGKVAIHPEFEAAVSFAAAMLTELEASGVEFSLAIGEEDLPPGTSRSHLFDCLSVLALAEIPRSTEPSWLEKRMAETSPNDVVVVLTSAGSGVAAAAAANSRLKTITF